jgi:hypothetical protein
MRFRQPKILESQIEKRLCAWAKKCGILCYKVSTPANRGMPDRMFIFEGQVIFVELKRPGCKPTELQKYVINELNVKGGVTAFWTDSFETARDVLATCFFDL